VPRIELVENVLSLHGAHWIRTGGIPFQFAVPDGHGALVAAFIGDIGIHAKCEMPAAAIEISVTRKDGGKHVLFGGHLFWLWNKTLPIRPFRLLAAEPPFTNGDPGFISQMIDVELDPGPPSLEGAWLMVRGMWRFRRKASRTNGPKAS
jgi:hypothetical protein